MSKSSSLKKSLGAHARRAARESLVNIFPPQRMASLRASTRVSAFLWDARPATFGFLSLNSMHLSRPNITSREAGEIGTRRHDREDSARNLRSEESCISERWRDAGLLENVALGSRRDWRDTLAACSAIIEPVQFLDCECP